MAESHEHKLSKAGTRVAAQMKATEDLRAAIAAAYLAGWRPREIWLAINKVWSYEYVRTLCKLAGPRGDRS